MLDLATLQAGAFELAERDRDLARVHQLHGPPPLWSRPPGFATLVRIILEQQVSLASARGTFGRLKQKLGGRISSKGVLQLEGEGLRELGFSRQKARYAVSLAQQVAARQFSIAQLQRLSDEAARQRLTSLLGFGNWSADVYLMMALRRPDVLPTGDLGLIKGIEEVCQRSFEDALAITEYAQRWRPLRSIATRMIWQAYLVRRGQDPHSISDG